MKTLPISSGSADLISVKPLEKPPDRCDTSPLNWTVTKCTWTSCLHIFSRILRFQKWVTHLWSYATSWFNLIVWKNCDWAWLEKNALLSRLRNDQFLIWGSRQETPRNVDRRQTRKLKEVFRNKSLHFASTFISPNLLPNNVTFITRAMSYCRIINNPLMGWRKNMLVLFQGPPPSPTWS